MMESMKTVKSDALARERYARYRQTEGYRQAQLRYRTSDKWKERQSIYGKYARENAKERAGARAAVAVAVRCGMLVKPDACPQCGTERVEAHHPLGYALEHWFTIQWLCSKCHKALHWV